MSVNMTDAQYLSVLTYVKYTLFPAMYELHTGSNQKKTVLYCELQRCKKAPTMLSSGWWLNYRLM